MAKIPVRTASLVWLRRMTASASFLMAACDSTMPEPARLTPQQLLGTYYLELLNGRPLPVATTSPGGLVRTTYEMVLQLEANETYTVIRDEALCAPPAVCIETRFRDSQRWLLLFDGTIDFEPVPGFPAPASTRATPDATTIVFGSNMVFRRVDPAAQLRSLDIRPDSLNLARGQAQNVFATTIPYSAVVNIVVRDTAIATLLPSGALLARSAGVTYIVATVAALRDSSKVTVR